MSIVARFISDFFHCEGLIELLVKDGEKPGRVAQTSHWLLGALIQTVVLFGPSILTTVDYFVSDSSRAIDTDTSAKYIYFMMANFMLAVVAKFKDWVVVKKTTDMRQDIKVLRMQVVAVNQEVAANRDGVAANRDGVAANRDGVAANRDGVAANRDGVAAVDRRVDAVNQRRVLVDEQAMLDRRYAADMLEEALNGLDEVDYYATLDKA
jgi:hypothetical protein